MKQVWQQQQPKWQNDKEKKESKNFYFPFHATMHIKLMRILFAPNNAGNRAGNNNSTGNSSVLFSDDDANDNDDDANNVDDSEVEEANRINCKYKIIFIYAFEFRLYSI